MTWISDLSVSAEVEVLPHHFELMTSDSESIGHGGKVVHGELDSLSPERVGNTDWLVKNMIIIQASLYIGPNVVQWIQHRNPFCCKEIDKIQSLLVGDPSPTCITTHPEFPNACLSRMVLTIAMHKYTPMEPGM